MPATGGTRFGKVTPATLFFAMDSSLECFSHALTPSGIAQPREFLDITAEERLRRVNPANLFDPPSRSNAGNSAYPGCVKWFPKICGHWSANRSLLNQIIEYHDATKHRIRWSSAKLGMVPAGVSGGHFLKPAPKQPMGNVVFTGSRVPRNQEHSLQSLAMAYREFIIDWLRLARREFETSFGNVFEEI